MESPLNDDKHESEGSIIKPPYVIEAPGTDDSIDYEAEALKEAEGETAVQQAQVPNGAVSIESVSPEVVPVEKSEEEMPLTNPASEINSDAKHSDKVLTGDSTHAAPMDPDFLASEILQARADLRSYLISHGHKDIVNIRVAEKVITEQLMTIEDIPELVQTCKENSHTISQQIILRNILSNQQVLEIGAKINNIDPVILSEVEVEEAQAKLIDFDEANRWKALPYSRNDFGNLLVAIVDPNDVEARSDIQKKLPDEIIEFKLATINELGTFLEKIFDPNASGTIAEIMAQVEAEASEALPDVLHVRETNTSAPVIRLVDELVRGAKNAGASDIHIESHENYALVRYRIDAMLRTIRTIDKKLEPRVISRIKTLANMKPDEKRVPQDGRISVMVENRPLDLRVATLPVVHGEQATLRLLDPQQATVPLEKLGMSEVNLKRYTEGISRPHGCCFITGPTGSGKSTTLYSSLSRVTTDEKKTMTLEDPVEYRFDDISQTDVSGGARGSDDAGKLTFAKVLKSVLRSDPDTIMVGEIRDTETARIAIDAALTGHFLYSTLHTNDALSTVTRLERIGVERFLIAAATEVIVAQRLIRKLCICKVQTTLNQEFLSSVKLPSEILKKVEDFDKIGEPVYRPNPEGCANCGGIGYKGRTGVHEVIIITEELRAAIEAGATLEEMEAIARGAGMGSLLDDAFERVFKGQTSFEEITRVVQ